MLSVGGEGADRIKRTSSVSFDFPGVDAGGEVLRLPPRDASATPLPLAPPQGGTSPPSDAKPTAPCDNITPAGEAHPTFISGFATEEERLADLQNFEGAVTRIDKYQDPRVFAPIIQDKVADHSSGLARAKWGSRVLLLSLVAGVCGTLLYFVVDRKEKSAEPDAFYGLTNSTVMLLEVKGHMRYWHEPQFITAVAAESGISPANVMVWDAWDIYLESAAALDRGGGDIATQPDLSPNAVRAYFQFLELDGVKTVERCVSLLAGAVSGDVVANSGTSPSGDQSVFRSNGFLLLSHLVVGVDLETAVRPTEAPATFAPPTEAPRIPSVTPTISLTEDPAGVGCGDVPGPGERCALSLQLDPVTGRCACRWQASRRRVCYDYECVEPIWSCNMTSTLDPCGFPFLDCRTRCERTPFCVGFLHDSRLPHGFSCSLRYREGLAPPGGASPFPITLGQLLPFASECELTGREVPKRVSVEAIPHLTFNATRAVVYIRIDRSPGKGRLFITPSASGITFIPFQVYFDPGGVLSRPIVVEAKETLYDSSGQPFFSAAIGTELSGGGYRVAASFIRSGLPALEYAEPDPAVIFVSDPGRAWVSSNLVTGEVLSEGVRRAVVLRLSSPFPYNVTVALAAVRQTVPGLTPQVAGLNFSNPASQDPGLYIYPRIVSFAALSQTTEASLYGLLEGVYTVVYKVMGAAGGAGTQAGIDAPPGTSIGVASPRSPGGGSAAVKNIAVVGQATQSSTEGSCGAACGPDAAIDGDVSESGGVAITRYGSPVDTSPWWRLGLPRAFAATEVVIWNRRDCCRSRFARITARFFSYGVQVYEEELKNPGVAKFRIARQPLLVFDAVVISKSPAPGGAGGPLADSIDATLNLLEVEVMSPDFVDLPVPQTPAPPTAQPVPTQFPPVPVTPDQVLYDIAWVGVLNQSSVFPGCDSCGPDAAVNHRVCTSASGGSEYTMTSSDVQTPDRAPWLSVTFPEAVAIHAVLLHNRQDCCQGRLRDLKVTVSYDTTIVYTSAVLNPSDALSGPSHLQAVLPTPLLGNKINVSKTNPSAIASIDMVLSIAELQVFSSTQVSASLFPPNATSGL